MNKLGALSSLTFAAIIVGSTLVISRVISTGSSIYCLQFISMIIASFSLILLIGVKNIKEEIKKINKSDYLIFLLQTLTGVVLFRVFIIYGVRLTKAIDAGVILSLTPITTVLLSIIFLREKPSKYELSALALASFGVLILNLNGVNSNSSVINRLLGNLLILLAVLGESTFVVCSKKATSNISSLTKSLMICLCAVVLFFPLSIYELSRNYSFLFEYNFWLLALYTGLILTVLAYVLWFRAIIYVNGTTAGVFNTLIPLSAILLVFIFLGESISRSQLAGLALILAAVSLVIYSNTKLPKKVKSSI